jgi:hypothetical protein
MVEELRNEETQTLRMPVRELSWTEASESLKCERLRTEIKILKRRVDILVKTVYKLEHHIHADNKLVIPWYDNISEDGTPPPMRSRNEDNEIF